MTVSPVATSHSVFRSAVVCGLLRLAAALIENHIEPDFLYFFIRMSDHENFGTVEMAVSCVSWTVPGFADLSEESYDSPPFSLGPVGGSEEWCIRMWPNGDRPEDEGHVSVDIVWLRDDDDDDMDAQPPAMCYQVSLLKHGHLAHTSQSTPGGERLHRFFQQAKVLNESGFLSCNGQLNFHLKCWREDTAEPSCPHLTQRNSQLPANDPHSFFFQRWYQDENCTDITVKVHDNEYKVHKFVLASRSRVFYAMFTQDMSEVNTNSLDVTDMTAEGFGGLLEYLYKGDVSDMNKFAAELLYAAEKYELDGLKTICVTTLQKIISADSALEVLSLADLYRARHLKTVAMGCIKRHAGSLTTSDRWVTFLRGNPQLASEVFCYMAQNPNPPGGRCTHIHPRTAARNREGRAGLVMRAMCTMWAMCAVCALWAKYVAISAVVPKVVPEFVKNQEPAMTSSEGWVSFLKEQLTFATEAFRHLLPTKTTK